MSVRSYDCAVSLWPDHQGQVKHPSGPCSGSAVMGSFGRQYLAKEMPASRRRARTRSFASGDRGLGSTVDGDRVAIGVGLRPSRAGGDRDASAGGRRREIPASATECGEGGARNQQGQTRLPGCPSPPPLAHTAPQGGLPLWFTVLSASSLTSTGQARVKEASSRSDTSNAETPGRRLGGRRVLGYTCRQDGNEADELQATLS